MTRIKSKKNSVVSQYQNKTKKRHIATRLNIKDFHEKFVVISSKEGFGNKLYDMFISVYFKYVLGYHVYCNEKLSIHNLGSDPMLIDIIPGIKNAVSFIDDTTDQYMSENLDIQKTNYLIFEYTRLGFEKIVDAIKKLNYTRMYFKPFRFYKCIYELYNSIKNVDLKKIFQMNTQYISSQTLALAKTKYSAIHIRYGDKLKYALHVKKNPESIFYLFNPLYYKMIIEKLTEYKLPIYIFTDSPKVVKHFILDKYNFTNDQVQILPTPFLDAFYLQYHATYLAGSISTMSYSAFIFSQIFNTGQTYLNYSITNIEEQKFGKDYFNLAEHVGKNIINIKHNKKYILYYDKPLIKKMINYI